MENELPKIDIVEDFTIGTGINENILNLYKRFPCRLKAEIFVLCMGGSITASINLSHFTIKKYDFITLSPGTIIQIHEINDNPLIYFMIFSSRFIHNINMVKTTMDVLYLIKENPVLPLPEKIASLYQDFFMLLIKTYALNYLPKSPEILKTILYSILYRLNDFYKTLQPVANEAKSRSKEICKIFMELVTQHYMQERNVSFYSQKIGITATHLSNTIKQTTGKTIGEIISTMVIMEAKTQLKSTTLPIKEIAYSLNFANVSFFGKYFKRYVGISPQNYREGR